METIKKYKNKIRCKFCGDIIESKHRHDFKKCKCGKVFVDGGLDYQRCGFPSESSIDDSIEILFELVD